MEMTFNQFNDNIKEGYARDKMTYVETLYNLSSSIVLIADVYNSYLGISLETLVENFDKIDNDLSNKTSYARIHKEYTQSLIGALKSNENMLDIARGDHILGDKVISTGRLFNDYANLIEDLYSYFISIDKNFKYYSDDLFKDVEKIRSEIVSIHDDILVACFDPEYIDIYKSTIIPEKKKKTVIKSNTYKSLIDNIKEAIEMLNILYLQISTMLYIIQMNIDIKDPLKMKEAIIKNIEDSKEEGDEE